MPNINLQEKDMSTFADQQFISIAYNGRTNEVGSNAKVLAYRVTFISDNTNYCIVEVGENQKVNIPTSPIKEGYTFKQWQLNGEAFDFSTVITSDILLIAEFEETPTPSGYTWNGTDTSEHDITSSNLQHYMGEAPSYAKADYIGATVVRKLGDVETEYVLTEDDVSEYEQDEMYALEITCGEHSSVGVMRGVEGYTDGLYFMKELEGSDVGQYTASMILAE